MTDLQLIERMGKATGPDRGLDAAIALALGMPREAFGPIYDQPGMVDGPDYHFDKGHWSGNGMTWRAPDFTSSIDAALTLVPEGWLVVSMTKGDLDRKYFDVRTCDRWSVMIARDGTVLKDVSEVLSFPSGKHPTPAIALCIAALKARAALASNSRGGVE